MYSILAHSIVYGGVYALVPGLHTYAVWHTADMNYVLQVEV